jgi:hypothetical protein
MTDKTDDIGKGHSRPGDAPRRPYATIDVKATELGRDGAQTPSPAGPKPERATAEPPPYATSTRAWAGSWASWLSWAYRAAALAGGLAAAGARMLQAVRGNAFLSHAAAGVAGATATLAVAGLLGLLAGRQAAIPPDAARRLAALEKAAAQQSALPAAFTGQLAAADKRLSVLEEQAKAIAALRNEQAKLAADAKALQTRIASTDATERVAKLEAAVTALSADPKSADAPERLEAKLADLERRAAEAKAATTRVDREVGALKGEAAGWRQGLEALKASVEERVVAKLAAVERDLRAVRATEAERAAGAQRILLALEIATLKRALDRGDSYARELEAARKTAGGAIDFSALDRSSASGVPTLGALAQDFKGVANAVLDAAADRPDTSVLDRLMAGARSVVRVRKAHYAADDTSVEATVSRMEAALKDGKIGEVLAQGKRLPPKAAKAAESWLRQLEARHAADRVMAEIEAALKASLTAAEPEPKR